MSGRKGHIKSSNRRMYSDTQGIHTSRRDCVRKNKREDGETVKRRRKEEKKKNNGSVEQKNINNA